MGSGVLDRPVSVALVEDLRVVVAGIRSWIASDPMARAFIVADGDSIEEVLDAPAQRADVLVLDLELGDGMIIDRVAELSDAGFRVVVFSVHLKPMTVRAALEAGACAFFDKRTEREEFLDVIVAAARGEPFHGPARASILARGVRLSDREQETLQHLFQGMDHASIALRLRKPTGEAISAHTVKQYIERARAKFAANGRPCRSNYSLLARCIEEGLIRPQEIGDYRSGQPGIDLPSS